METKSVAEIVESLGGPKRLAKKLKIQGSAVKVWVRERRIPPVRYKDLRDVGHRMGVSLTWEELANAR